MAAFHLSVYDLKYGKFLQAELVGEVCSGPDGIFWGSGLQGHGNDSFHEFTQGCFREPDPLMKNPDNRRRVVILLFWLFRERDR